MCEFCGDGPLCGVCRRGYDDEGGVAVLAAPADAPSDDPYLEAARLGRLSGLRGEGYEANPHPPGSPLYGWFGGAQLTARDGV